MKLSGRYTASLLAFLLLGFSALEVRAADAPAWPHFKIEGDGWVAWVVDPTADDAYYSGRRFARAGMVPSAEWNGVPVFGELVEPERRDRGVHDHVGGISDEFDIEGPSGFDSASEGGTFVKIGVGLLKRGAGEEYLFFEPHEVAVPPKIFAEQRSPRAVFFRESLASREGEPIYEMDTQVAIEDGALVVRRTLKNTGTEAIDTEFYGHNFVRIGDRPIGQGYSIDWSQTLEPTEFENPCGAVLLGERGIEFESKPKKSYYFSHRPEQVLPANLPIRVTQRDEATMLEVSLDRPLDRFAVWGSNRVLCPEPFARIAVAPGESETWTATYRATQTAP